MNRQLFILLISCTWPASEIALGFIKHSREGSIKGLDRTSLRVLWITITLSVSIGVFIGMKAIGFIASGSMIISNIGLTLVLIGLIIRWVAILTLRRYFTVDVAIVKDHIIVDRGLYRYIRHPAYAGSILSFLGLGLVFSNWLSTLVIFLPILSAFLYRIRVEEAALINTFGDSYKNYSKRTHRLVPGIY
jgi:protein-S-isoprenylcysteine O-methyltransferase Ste14